MILQGFQEGVWEGWSSGEQGFGEGGMNLTNWADGVWADGSHSPEAWGEGGGQPQQDQAPARVISGVRRRRFVELEGQLVEVSGYEEAERLLNELKTEEKAQEKDRKRLTILLRKAEAKPTVGIYRAHEQIQALEVKMDDRASRIEALATVIQQKLDEINDINEDDEEVMLLS